MKIIIIGAGAAGITAAHILSSRNIDFEVLEASSIHGGRLKKDNDLADFPIDLGAEWIHKFIKAQPEVLDELLVGKTPGYDTYKYIPDSIKLFKNNKLKNISWLKFLLYLIGDYKFVDKTWYDYFDELVTPEIKKRIRYNSPVRKIDYSTDEILIYNEAREIFTSNKVLITVPIKILQEQYIEFIPALPQSKERAINEEQVGDGIKVFIEFSKQFYPDLLEINKLLKNPFKDDFAYYNAAYGKNSEKHILGLFAHGPSATKYVSKGSDKKIIDFILMELDSIFNNKASQHYIDHIVQNWSKEPFIRGSYSTKKGDAKKLASPIDNKIYFAGEAYNEKGNTIAVHGASESAYLALEKMLKAE